MNIERWLYTIPLRVRSLFRSRDVDRALDEELEYHIERQIESNLSRGMTPGAARRAALRSMGGVAQVREACRDWRATSAVETALRDCRYAGRLLMRNPVFAAVAVFSLALGIGANAAVFQLIDVIGLRSLPITNPHELAEVRIDGVRNFGVQDGFNSEMTYPLWAQVRDHQTAFSGMFAWGSATFLIGGSGATEPSRGLWTSGDFFRVLGVRAVRGRLLDVSDDHRGCGAGPVVVSHAFWQRYFGGQDGAIGRTLTILGQPFTVVGITSPTFTGLEVGRTFDFALPVCAAGLWGNGLDQRNYWWLTVMGRLKPGWTVAQAGEQLRALSPALFEATTPSGYSAASTRRYLGFRLTTRAAGRGVSWLRSDYGALLWLLLGMTALVMLITCGNLATLMLARGSARAREFAVRIALGASRRRIVSQMIVESLLIAGAGAALAIPVAVMASRALVAFISTSVNPVHLGLFADRRIVSFTAGVALFTTLLFGLLPALRVSIVAPNDVMRGTSRGSTVDRRRSAFQRALVVGQIALSLVLVVSASLFVRSFRNLLSADTGFRQDGVVAVSFMDLHAGNLPLEQRLAFQARITQEIQSAPGVTAAASSTLLPLSGAGWTQAFRLTGVAGAERRGSRFTYVSPGYFNTLEIPFVGGRDFATTDTAASPRVALVNQAFVRSHLGGMSPLGTAFRTFAEPGYPETTYEIIGVVADTKYADLREETQAIAYVPIAQHPALRPWADVIVRSSVASATVTSDIRQRIGRLNPGIALRFTELKSQVRELLAGDRMMAWLAGSFGLLAIMLAAVGLYGLIAYLVAGRRNEIGIRLSLGATRTQVVRLVLRESLQLLALGLAIGLPVSLIVMRQTRAVVFGLSPADPSTLLGAGCALGVIAVLAAGIPAWRASRLDPATALRCD